jgi:hypothetical protein
MMMMMMMMILNSSTAAHQHHVHGTHHSCPCAVQRDMVVVEKA